MTIPHATAPHPVWRYPRGRLLAAVCAFALLLAGCSDDKRSAPDDQVGGRVAIGAPVSGAQVELRCVGFEGTTTSDLNGAWQIDIPQGSAPCLIKASGGTPAVTLYSYAASAGTINVTPLTTLALASAVDATGLTALESWFDTADPGTSTLSAQVAAGGTELKTSLTDAGFALPSDFDPFTQAFQAVAGDPHDDLLEALAAAMAREALDLDDLLAAYGDGAALPDATETPAVQYTVGGSISGLSGSVVLQNNGGDNLTRTTNGSFAFGTALNAGTSYAVSILTQPAGQTCTITNGSGTISANVSNVSITCATNPPPTYTLGGTISGLTGTVVLQNNGGDNLTRTTDGSFAFGTAINAGSSYAVSILTQPAGQTCTISNGSGTINANVSNVSVTCTTNPPPTYTLGGSISGLTGTVVLQNNGGNNLTRNSNGSFTFAGTVNAGSTYSISVLTQPSGQTCTVSNGSGTANANVSNISVTCVDNAPTTYTIGGSISGLTGTVVLRNNGGSDLSRSSNGSFTFATSVSAGGSYAVTVQTQPSGQICTVTSGSGTANANVTNVSVVCQDESTVQKYKIGGQVRFMQSGKTIVLQNNGANDVTLTQNGAYEFEVPAGSTYSISVLTQPEGHLCEIAAHLVSGTATQNLTGIHVNCQEIPPAWSLDDHAQCKDVDTSKDTLLQGRNGVAAYVNGTACVSLDTQPGSGWPLTLGSTFLDTGDPNLPSSKFGFSLRQLTVNQSSLNVPRTCSLQGTPSLGIHIDSYSYHGSPMTDQPDVGCQITITEMSPTHFAGTFSGTLYGGHLGQLKIVTLTNGEFRFAVDLFQAGNGLPLAAASFEGLSTGALTDKGNGEGDFGWQANWRHVRGDVVDTSASPLAATAGSTVLSGGSRAHQMPNSTDSLDSRDARLLERGIDGDFYVSALLRTGAAATPSVRTALVFGNIQLGFGIDTGNADQQFMIGMMQGVGNETVAIQRFGGKVEAQRTYLLVARMRKADGSDIYNRMDAWLDPTPQSLDVPTATVTTQGGTGAPRIVDRIGHYGFRQNTPLLIDRIRVSDSWDGIFHEDAAPTGN